MIDPSGDLLAEVDDVGAVYAGTVDADPRVRATETRSAPPEIGALRVGRGLSVRVARAFVGMFEVRLALPAPPSRTAVPAAVHVASDGTVRVEPGLWDPATNEIVVQASTFSDRWGAWFDPRNWVEEVVQSAQGAWDFVADFVTGRTDPPHCDNDPPSWSRTSIHQLSSLHVCTQGNPTRDGVERFEAYLASNRRTAQIVSIPTVPRDYIWVENQSEQIRRAAAAFARVEAGANAVVFGGHATSIGFRRPQFSVDFELRAYQTWPVIIVNPLLALLGNLPLNGTLALLAAAAKCVSEFSGIDITRADVIPDGFDSPSEFVGQLVRCSFELLQEPDLVVGVSDELLRGAGFGVIDRNTLVGTIRSGADIVAPIARRLFAALNVASVAVNAWDGIFDNLAAGSVSTHLEGTISDDSLAALRTCGNCTVTGRVAMTHPTWGRIHILTFGPPAEGECTGVELLAVDEGGRERWRHTISPGCYYHLAPAGQGPYGSPALRSPVDTANRAFFDYDPGRYNGVIVLAPIPNGFEDFDTLPSVENYDARFYYAIALDADGDGVYEVEQTYNDCFPGCAGGQRSTTLHRFIADDFQGIPPESSTMCGTEYLDVSANEVATQITANHITCDDARAVIHQIGETIPFFSGPTQVASGVFECTITREYSDVYHCTSGAATIDFDRFLYATGD